jgi:hypothetical protein
MSDGLTSGMNELDALLARARDSLGQLRREPDPDEEPRSAVGEAGEGKVRAEVAPDGRLASLTVDPRLMRLGSEALCEQIVLAVNAALDGLRADAPTASAPAVDPAVLNERLAELQDESMRQMQRYTTVLGDLAARLRERPGTDR